MHMQEDQPAEVRVSLCQGASLWSRLAAGVAAAAFVLHVVSVSSSYWLEATIRQGATPVAHVGLWGGCSAVMLFTARETWLCLSYSAEHHVHTAPAFLKVTQAFAILGIFGHVATCVMLLVLTLLPKLANHRVASIVAMVTSLLSGLFVLVAMSVYPSSYPPQAYPPFTVDLSVSWCFALDFLSLLASLAAAAILLWDFRHRVAKYSTSVA